MGLPVHRSQRSGFGFPVFPQGQAPSSGFVPPNWLPGGRNQTALEFNRGTTKRNISSHFRRRSRGTHVLHILHFYRVPDHTESIWNRYFARSRNSVGWMDGTLSSSVPSNSVDNGHTAPRRPCE
jgi:hypothetical protein